MCSQYDYSYYYSFFYKENLSDIRQIPIGRIRYVKITDAL